MAGTRLRAKRGESRAGPSVAVVYARVSSVEQQREGFSIPAQLKLLRDYAVREGFPVAREFTDAETAKNTGRPAFAEMLTYLKRSSCQVVLVEKTDRLYRNFRDYVTLDELDVEVHLVKEGVILSRDSRSHEKFIHGIKVLMAKNYVDNLSEEVQKATTEKASQGFWPSRAPLGYKNNLESHLIEKDPDQAPIIVRLFEEAADGRMTLDRLSEAAYQRGLRSRRSKGRITREGVKRILSNRLYWGPFMWDGRLYQGKHEPLVSKELFDVAQIARRKKSKPRRSKNSFAFTGLASCKCGRRLGGMLARGRYRYYACSARCGTRPVKEAELSAFFLDHVKAIHVDEKVAEYILEAVKGFEATRRQENEERLERLQGQQRSIQQTIDAAYDDKLNGRISEEYWVRRSNGWAEELAAVGAQIRELEGANFDSFTKADQLLRLCQRAPELFVKQNYDEQARLINLIETNSKWDGVTLRATYREPFDILLEGLQCTHGGPDGGVYSNFLGRLWRRLDELSPLPDNLLDLAA